MSDAAEQRLINRPGITIEAIQKLSILYDVFRDGWENKKRALEKFKRACRDAGYLDASIDNLEAAPGNNSRLIETLLQQAKESFKRQLRRIEQSFESHLGLEKLVDLWLFEKTTHETWLQAWKTSSRLFSEAKRVAEAYESFRLSSSQPVPRTINIGTTQLLNTVFIPSIRKRLRASSQNADDNVRITSQSCYIWSLELGAQDVKELGQDLYLIYLSDKEWRSVREHIRTGIVKEIEERGGDQSTFDKEVEERLNAGFVVCPIHRKLFAPRGVINWPEKRMDVSRLEAALKDLTFAKAPNANELFKEVQWDRLDGFARTTADYRYQLELNAFVRHGLGATLGIDELLEPSDDMMIDAFEIPEEIGPPVSLVMIVPSLLSRRVEVGMKATSIDNCAALSKRAFQELVDSQRAASEFSAWLNQYGRITGSGIDELDRSGNDLFFEVTVRGLVKAEVKREDGSHMLMDGRIHVHQAEKEKRIVLELDVRGRSRTDAHSFMSRQTLMLDLLLGSVPTSQLHVRQKDGEVSGGMQQSDDPVWLSGLSSELKLITQKSDKMIRAQVIRRDESTGCWNRDENAKIQIERKVRKSVHRDPRDPGPA